MAEDCVGGLHGPGATGSVRASDLGGAINGATAGSRWSLTVEERAALLPALRLVLDARPVPGDGAPPVPPAVAADAVGMVVEALLSDDVDAALPHSTFNTLLQRGLST
jgi:hypothetical protein